MIYILLIWTVVGASDSPGSQMHAYYDWRPIGEFHANKSERNYDGKELCEQAAKQLGLQIKNYRCVRSM